MQYCIQSDEESELFGPGRGCADFEQQLLRLDGDPSARVNASEDEVIYVLAGRGRGSISGEPMELAPGTAAYVPAGHSWQVDESEGLEMLSVLVRDPLPADGARPSVVGIEEAVTGEATAGRMFRLLAPCPSATQFVGYIPPGRAPDHFHRYDEVVYVLAGTGALHIGGESAPLRPGSCIHLPARLVHSLENSGPGEMQVLGVFTPAGSPAEAYYPDGTLAYQY